jgi:hypothetical protein
MVAHDSARVKPDLGTVPKIPDFPSEVTRKKSPRETNLAPGQPSGLPMTLDASLKLLDGTGRQNKAGNIPAECAPMLDRLQCSAETPRMVCRTSALSACSAAILPSFPRRRESSAFESGFPPSRE